MEEEWPVSPTLECLLESDDRILPVGTSFVGLLRLDGVGDNMNVGTSSVGLLRRDGVGDDMNEDWCVENKNASVAGSSGCATGNLESRTTIVDLSMGDGVPANVNEGFQEPVDDTTTTNDVEPLFVEPKVGMRFPDYDALYQFYLAYSRQAGFPIRKRSSRKATDGMLHGVTMTCGREGQKRNRGQKTLKPQPSMECGCTARITATCDTSGAMTISVVNLDHNHALSPSKSRVWRCNRKLPDHVKRKLEVNDIAGIPLHKSFNSAVVEAGGYEQLSFIEKDCRNYVEQVRRVKLCAGDAMAIQSYFRKMQAKSDGFFFSMDLDEESRLKNLFWADKRSREAYKYFGDVITFDTTYLTNKYEMPFSPFVGVNHHGKSILLGCGLMCCEDTNSFVWLFRTWLECMEGIPPRGIITDQDRAMQSAIGIVFPDIKHRWCLWHIMKKAPEKFGGHVDTDKILRTLQHLVYDVYDSKDFVLGWQHMIDEYELHDNMWLPPLFAQKERWIPCYLRSTFWAGMSTTQRSESMNAFFDGYVHAKTTLTQFVDQYERALRKKVENEFQADSKSLTKNVPCVTTYPMEKQVQEVYTLAKFKEFQTELIGKMYCDILKDVNGLVYTVVEDFCGDGYYKRKSFEVEFNKETNVAICNCHLFEFRGIVCRHSVVVLIRNEVTLLPDAYILSRWRRDVRRSYTRVRMDYDGLACSEEQIRYETLCTKFQALANIVADDVGRTKKVIEWIDGELVAPISSNTNVVHTPEGNDDHLEQISVLDPMCSRRKGAPHKNRLKSTLEKRMQKRKVDKNGPGKRRKQVPTHQSEDKSEPLVEQVQPWDVPGKDGVYDLTLSNLELSLQFP